MAFNGRQFIWEGFPSHFSFYQLVLVFLKVINTTISCIYDLKKIKKDRKKACEGARRQPRWKALKSALCSTLPVLHKLDTAALAPPRSFSRPRVISGVGPGATHRVLGVHSAAGSRGRGGRSFPSCNVISTIERTSAKLRDPKLAREVSTSIDGFFWDTIFLL